MPMTVKAILSRKGNDVITIEPTVTLSAAVNILAEHRIGALVVVARGDGLDERFERAFGGLRTERDRFLGAVKFEQTDAAELRVDHHVGRVAGKPRARDPILHDIEGFDHHRGDSGTSRPAEVLTLKE